MRIVIATPIRDRAWALPSWWRRLWAAALQAKRGAHQIEICFLENDSVDGTLQHLEMYSMLPGVRVLKHDFGYAHYRALRGSDLVNTKNDKGELAHLRNMLIDAFLETDAHYLVMWDSDVWMPLEALSAHPRSLVSVMEAHPEIGTLCADVQHPHCKGKFHNAMVENTLGQINHPDRSECVLPEWLIDVWSVTWGQVLRPKRVGRLQWDQSRSSSGWRHEMLYLAEVATTGGGGAAIIRRSALEEGACYGAHILGEDVKLCRGIREQGLRVALYSGIRGLHLSRKLFEEAGRSIVLGASDSDEARFGVWVEDWLKGRQTVAAEQGEPNV